MKTRKIGRPALIFLFAAAFFATTLPAAEQPLPNPEDQGQTGELVCKVLDAAGNGLAGVNVSLTGLGPAPQSQLSSAEGIVRFPGLAPGNYQLEAMLEGFAKVEYPNVSIIAGRASELEIVMKPAPPGTPAAAE